ncbi:MAG: hypothetical protein RR521_08220 [Clostridia bacterium]
MLHFDPASVKRLDDSVRDADLCCCGADGAEIVVRFNADNCQAVEVFQERAALRIRSRTDSAISGWSWLTSLLASRSDLSVSVPRTLAITAASGDVRILLPADAGSSSQVEINACTISGNVEAPAQR